MDLETKAKPRFLSHEELRAGFLTDLENGTVIQLSQTAKPTDYIYSVACVVWLWVLDVKLNNNEITSYLKLTSYTINIIFRDSWTTMNSKS